MPRARPRPEVRRLQLGRERAGHLPRPRHPALQPALGDRGHGDRRLRDGRDRRLQLHPRRIPRRALPALRVGARGGLRGRPPRQGHPGHRHRLRPVRRRRRRGVHLRRGDGAPRVARGQARQAALQAAVSGELRPVRQADDHQQHAVLRLGARDPAQGREVVRGDGRAECGRHGDLFRVGPRREARQLRVADGHPVPRAARDQRRHAARAASSRPSSRAARPCRCCRPR